MKKIGLFFGSFNPVHIGHLFVAEMAIEKADLDEVWFIVSPASPYKMHTGELAPETDRYNMVVQAIKYNRKLKVSDVEFSMSKPSYTANTVKFLKEKNAQNKFSLICGTDVYVDIESWFLGKELVDSIDEFIVYPRNSSKVYSPESMAHKTVWLLNVPSFEISATFIRNQIKNNKTTEHILPREVKEYIINNNLYK